MLFLKNPRKSNRLSSVFLMILSTFMSAYCPPFSKKALREALNYYSGSPAYLRCQTAHSARVDIFGNEVDLVTEEQAKYAFQRYSEKYDQEKKEESHVKRLDQENIKDVEDQLPKPVGYRILVLPFTPKEKTKGGILFSQEQLDKARIATTCGYVLKMGDLAYADKDKFNKPWCKVGDWVMFARYAGARLPIEGGEVRILNDDEVLGTIGDPESVLHYI